VRAAAGFIDRDGNLAMRRTQHVQDDAALERPSGGRGERLRRTSPG
jgi:hypothetical protein